MLDVPPSVLCSLFLRPYARGTVLAYELVLRRTFGERVYDRSICFVNNTDAGDLRRAVPALSLLEAV